MEASSHNEPTHREKVFTIISVALLMMLLPLSETIHTNFPEPVFKFVAGYILGMCATVGYSMTVRMLNAAKQGRLLVTIDANKWMRPFSFFNMVFIVLFGLLAWVVSWEGRTGLYYGFGVASATALSALGVCPILKNGK